MEVTDDQIPLDISGRWCPVPMGKAYAWKPGSGPEGERCGTCVHAVARERGKRYWKCGLVPPTCGPGTDIRLKTPACKKWEPKP